MSISHDTKGEHRRLLVAGVALLTVLGVLIWLSIQVYQKEFQDFTRVTIKAERAGLQLPQFGDVRDQGALVGLILDVSHTGEKAAITLGFRPEAASRIPSNSSFEIRPTTLFGQKYVAVVRPEDPDGEPLHDGMVVPASRVKTNVELARVLSNLYPLLRSVNPASLNATLNALASALNGRGEELGRTLDELESYLGTLQQQLPDIRKNLEKLARVADAYEKAAPDLLSTLRNVTVTSRTIKDQKQQLRTFFADLTGLARTGTKVLRENEENLVRVGEVTAPITQLLATYSPEFPCLLKGLARYRPILAETFEGGYVRQYIEFFNPQYEAYGPEDKPVYGEIGHGPWCAGLPYPEVPSPGFALDQGTTIDENPPQSPLPVLLQFSSSDSQLDSGNAGTPMGRSVVTALLSRKTGRPADSYSAVSAMMYAPLVRGEVPS